MVWNSKPSYWHSILFILTILKGLPHLFSQLIHAGFHVKQPAWAGVINLILQMRKLEWREMRQHAHFFGLKPFRRGDFTMVISIWNQVTDEGFCTCTLTWKGRGPGNDTVPEHSRCSACGWEQKEWIRHEITEWSKELVHQLSISPNLHLLDHCSDIVNTIPAKKSCSTEARQLMDVLTDYKWQHLLY